MPDPNLRAKRALGHAKIASEASRTEPANEESGRATPNPQITEFLSCNSKNVNQNMNKKR